MCQILLIWHILFSSRCSANNLRAAALGRGELTAGRGGGSARRNTAGVTASAVPTAPGEHC